MHFITYAINKVKNENKPKSFLKEGFGSGRNGEKKGGF